MNGILCVDKPAEHTSFDVVARMRGIARTRKIGHGGTLDPAATGVLPLFFGRAAKAADLLPDQDKTYTATFRLGVTTDTQDMTGTILRERSVTVGKAEVEAAFARFTGTISQVPPMYSAVQVDGRRLYDLARQGIEVERPPRKITIYSLTMLDWDEAAGHYTVEADCSKGAYIRTLCHDLGEYLGCGAALTELRRTRACGFGLDDCVTLEQAQELAAEDSLADALLPVEEAFRALPRFVLTGIQAKHFCNGVTMSLNQFSRPPEELSAVYRDDGLFLGLAEPHSDGQTLKLVKLFHLQRK